MTAGVTEALNAPTPQGSDLQAGLETISLNQTVTFTKYVKLVLPVDGFVFWVKADLLSTSALANASALNSIYPNKPRAVLTPAATAVVQCSVHVATDIRQGEEETIAINSIVFTSQQEIQDMNQVGPTAIFVAEFQGLKFAFSSRASFYQQADLWHYRGQAVYSDMETQLVNTLDGFDAVNQIVSNSLPIWLGLNGYTSSIGITNPLPLYPSFLLPLNVAPPYGAVHIIPESTQAIEAAPFLDSNLNHSQLVMERVRITMYGLRNFNAMNFVDFFNQYTLDNDIIGIMNLPTIRDEKKSQAELQVIAQKKSIEYEVNYYQSQARQVARTLIASAFVSVELNSLQLNQQSQGQAA